VSDRPRAVLQLLAWLLLISTAGCSPTGVAGNGAAGQDGNKAGAPSLPRTLTLATVDDQRSWDAPLVEAFAAHVADLSHGRLAIDITWQVESENPEFEQAIIDHVRGGDFDLGWVGGRAFDLEGVTTLEALQTPFLITDYAVLRDVYESDVPSQMLAGLGGGGLVGLGLYPGWLSHPASLGAPLLSLEDFQGINFRVPASHVSDLLVQALGAKPMHIAGLAASNAIAAGRMDAILATLASVPIPTLGAAVTGNITFFPDSRALFANAQALAALPDDDRQILNEAAAKALDVALNQLPTVDDGSQVCRVGHSVVAAPATEVARIEAAASPVRDALHRDPTVGPLIDRIAAIRGSRPDPPAPPTCSAPGAPSPKPSLVAAADPMLVGTWQTPRLTREVLRAALTRNGIDPAFEDDLASNDGFRDWIVYRVEIKDGRWSIYDFPDGVPAGVGWSGTYEVPAPGTAIASEGPCPVTYHYRVTATELRFDDLQSCSATDNKFQVAIYLSAPFTRVR
jgi:TRAP-type C4-dicarboxylate transport system substrate-binding protein